MTIHLLDTSEINHKEMEKLLLLILENTSEDIENIQIAIFDLTNNFNEEFKNILESKKNIKNFQINFHRNISIYTSCFLLKIFDSSSRNGKLLDEKLKNYYMYLQKFHSIESFEFSLNGNRNFDDKYIFLI